MSTLTSLFNKKIGCPSSQCLVEYHQTRLAADQMDRVENHLANCDFCSAELQLLARHLNDGDDCSFAEMPAQLRRLAKRWLKRSVPALGLLSRFEVNHRV